MESVRSFGLGRNSSSRMFAACLQVFCLFHLFHFMNATFNCISTSYKSTYSTSSIMVTITSHDTDQHLDTETASLVAQLQKEDVGELLSCSKRKQKEGTLTDAQVALQLCLEDLNLVESTATDESMARSMASAILADEILLQEMSAENDRALRDRELALRLSNQPYGELHQLPAIVHPAQDAVAHQPKWDDLTMAKICARQAFFLKAEGQGVFYNEADAQAEPSQAAALRKPADIEETLQCAACTGNRMWFETVKLPCGHDYCEDCISDLFEQSMNDETLYPPRCCRQPIPLNSTSPFLRAGLFEAFNEKKTELDASDRLYCHEPSCNAFIPPDQIEHDIATCPQCHRNTCTICRRASHLGDCPEDTELQQVLQLAQETGWQRCYKCHRLVELDRGCYHMT